jgi:hypothetical protein
MKLFPILITCLVLLSSSSLSGSFALSSPATSFSSSSCPQVVRSSSGQVSISPSPPPSCVPTLANEARNLMSANFSQAAQIALSQVPSGYELITVGLCGPSQSLDYCVDLLNYKGSFNVTIQGQRVTLGYSVYEVQIDQSMHVIDLQGPFHQLNYWGTKDTGQVATYLSNNT